jgi:hypothetical protein
MEIDLPPEVVLPRSVAESMSAIQAVAGA